MRISIIGPTGGGKTTLAQQIAKRLTIPHIQLDRFWFENGGKLGQPEVESKQVAQRILEKLSPLLEQQDWVCDGSYPRIQPYIAERANALIFVDIPFFERARNHLIRIHTHSKRHPEIGYWDDLTYIGEMLRRRVSGNREKIMAIAEKYPQKLVQLKSRKEINAYLEALTQP